MEIRDVGRVTGAEETAIIVFFGVLKGLICGGVKEMVVFPPVLYCRL